MENKIKPSEKPIASKIIYGAAIAILCITAIVVGIVSAARKPEEPPQDNSGITDGAGNQGGTSEDGGSTETPPPATEDKKQVFLMPLEGETVVGYDLTTPVFSHTLKEWRVHAGIDVSCEAGATVYASEDGVVTGVYSDPLLGYTVEISHDKEFVTRYSNLDSSSATTVKVGDEVKSGDAIGTVGDSSLSELAMEPHLHFEMLVKGVKVNPADYIKTKDNTESAE